MKNLIVNKGVRLFIILCGFFVANALVAEFIGMKIFQFEDTVGIAPINWSLFGNSGTLQLSAGVILWPIVFITTDIINEYFGKNGVKLLSYMTAGLILYAFFMISQSIDLPPVEWWITSYEANGIEDMQLAFSQVFGQGLWMIWGSVIAFLVGQLLDALVFHRVRKVFGERRIWLRATASTAVSQLIDSFIVLYIAFVLGPAKWPLDQFFAVGTVNYSYKLFMAILLIPLLYLMRYLIDKYLGKELSQQLRSTAIH